jgi:hypothetical protein
MFKDVLKSFKCLEVVQMLFEHCLNMFMGFEGLWETWNVFIYVSLILSM